MTDSPYTQGWPKELEEPIGREAVDGWVVVPLSDAERLREALDDLVRSHDDTRFEGPASQHEAQQQALVKARDALNPERGE